MKSEFELTPRLAQALAFARIAHGSQVRHTTGAPYWYHPVGVASLVAYAGGTETMLIAALLHDVVEDTKATRDDIVLFFGEDVAILVAWLTDISVPSDGNRAKRKKIDREHSHQSPADAQTVKLGDVIDNLASIHDLDIDFAKVYVVEKRALVEGLDKGSPVLYRMATEAIDRATDILWERT